jgi:hypothetical protein
MRRLVSPLDGIRSPFGPRIGGSPPTPGGASDVLLLANGTDGLLLTDGTSFLKLASSS